MCVGVWCPVGTWWRVCSRWIPTRWRLAIGTRWIAPGTRRRRTSGRRIPANTGRSGGRRRRRTRALLALQRAPRTGRIERLQDVAAGRAGPLLGLRAWRGRRRSRLRAAYHPAATRPRPAIPVLGRTTGGTEGDGNTGADDTLAVRAGLSYRLRAGRLSIHADPSSREGRRPRRPRSSLLHCSITRSFHLALSTMDFGLSTCPLVSEGLA